MKRIAAALAATVMCVAPAYADEQSEKEARALFKEGNKALNDGNFVDAVDMYRAAYKRWPNPKILLNLGTSLRQLGRFAEAAETYDRYLADPAADPKQVPEVQKILGELAKKVGKLNVTVTEPGARILVDGREVGQSGEPISVRVDPGSHGVVVEKDGFAPATATVSVKSGEERAVELKLVATTGGTTKLTETDPQPDPDKDVAAVGDPVGDGAGGGGGGGGGDGAIVKRRAEPASRGGLGLFARFDAAPLDDGGVGIVGATYGLGDSFELAGAALIGMPAKGGWVGARLFLGSSSFRPTLTAGVPIVSADGIHVGVQGAAGLQLDLAASFGLFVDVGAMYFPDQDANAFIFTPSVGMQIRL